MSKDINLNNQNFGFEDFEAPEEKSAVDKGAEATFVPVSPTTEPSEATLETNLAIAFSSKVVFLLKGKLKDHNKKHPSDKVTLSQLKTVYRGGANAFSPSGSLGKTRGEWALARVNMFLEIKSNKSKINAKDAPLTPEAKSPTFEMDIVLSKESPTREEEFDLTGALTPRDGDFEQASKDIKEHGLNYDFQNIDELYLEDYKPLGFIWQKELLWNVDVKIKDVTAITKYVNVATVLIPRVNVPVTKKKVNKKGK